VPLSLSNHSELAAQFARFTRQIVNLQPAAVATEQSRQRAPFLGLF
jgi:hypothetical protein